ncbi:MAG: CNNM domain-containing protein, partial [Planctomycetota bacterium]
MIPSAFLIPLVASLARDLTFVAYFVVAEVIVVLSTWAAVALEHHSRSAVLDLARLAGNRERTAAWLGHVGAYEFAVRLTRFLGSALLVVGIAFLILHDYFDGTATQDRGFPWGPLGVTLLVVFVVSFVLNDVVVRLLARRHPNRFLLRALPYLEAVRLGTAPLRAPLVWLARLAFRARLQSEASTPREEVLESVEEGEREGSISPDEADMIESIIEFGEGTVEDVLTPRGDMAVLAADSTIAEAIEFVLEDGHSRIPVYEKDR